MDFNQCLFYSWRQGSEISYHMYNVWIPERTIKISCLLLSLPSKSEGDRYRTFRYSVARCRKMPTFRSFMSWPRNFSNSSTILSSANKSWGYHPGTLNMENTGKSLTGTIRQNTISDTIVDKLLTDRHTGNDNTQRLKLALGEKQLWMQLKNLQSLISHLWLEQNHNIFFFFNTNFTGTV